MTKDDDRKKKYLRIFRGEAEEHLSVINLGLVDLEEGKAHEEQIHGIFRAAHTLKGSARMLGLETIGAIAHKMEDVLKEIDSKALEPASHVVDRLLEGADSINRILSEEEVDAHAVINRLSEIMGAGEEAEEGAEAEAVSEEEKGKAEQEEPPREESPQEPPSRLEAGKAGVATDTQAAPSTNTSAPDTGRQWSKSDTLRVEASKLDNLIDLSGELLISKLKLEGKVYSSQNLLDTMTELIQGFDGMVENGNKTRFKAKLQEVRNRYHDFLQEFGEDIVELDLNLQDMQNGALQLRMTPAGTMFDEFPRLVRDLARDLEKEISLEVSGEETEIDKRLLEKLRGPLVHIIRNSCDHGVERPDEREKKGKPRRGKISVQAYHHGPSVVIEIEDDGAGMNADRIRKASVSRGLVDERTAADMTDEEVFYLTMRPGFSTSEIITDLSGRGVGLDVVKNNVEELRGDLDISSAPDAGTRITLRLPLTISIISALLVMQGGEPYAIPLTAVEEVVRVRVKELETNRGKEALTVRGRLLTLVRLGDLLGLSPLAGSEKEPASEEDFLNVVVLKFRNQHLALEVDQVLREQDILVKSLGSRLQKASLVSGATILRKGEPALILSVFDIFAEALRMEERGGIKQKVVSREKERHIPRILVVDDSITTRTIEKNILDRAGYEVTTAVDGTEALARMEDAGPFDLFVLDVDMPGLDGFELTERLRENERTSETPVVICTSRASDEDKRKGISVGAQAYIVKGSFDQNVLLDTVKSLIGE
ncbi:MAG: hybrid sensor histidine kinase/response regulator [bacterium]